MVNILWVGVGGALGAMLRYVLSLQMQAGRIALFPYTTLFINLSGCFAIGLLSYWLLQQGHLADYGPLLITGFLGGYTTFSSFGLELLSLLSAGLLGQAAAYVLASNVGGLLAVWAGRAVAARLG
ncbi:MAG: fluoride efflux transporter CrcB [Anaerolineales bacterium]|nr:fluoride efflux transporter CrcB [Anaerolineales bacterium]